MVEEDYFYKNVATCKRQAEKEKRFMRATSTSILVLGKLMYPSSG